MFGSTRFRRFLLAHVAACVDFDAGPAGTAIGDGDFDLERVAAVGGGWPGGDGKEVRLQLLVQPVQKLLLADRDDAVGPRRRDAGFLNGLVQRRRLHVGDVLRIRAVA